MKTLFNQMHTQSPSYEHHSKIYTETNNISMGNPLDPSFSNNYMSYEENVIFKKVAKPKIYIRYVDDHFILAKNKQEVDYLKTTF